uniref:PDZ domain-containing protein n=1 Tax=Petromyzon marinus TaxID=7757 RepID=S4RD83_PETMA
HLNKRTQFENPVVEAKRRRQRQRVACDGDNPDLAPSLLVLPRRRPGVWVFTRDPRELHGSSVRASLLKTSQGFGFTIVGGDTPHEFLQVRGLVPDGPATRDGRMRRGDVIVYVNNTCVLGFTQKEVVRMFQSVPVGDSVDLQLCRGYPLPYDPDDPDLEVPPYQDGRPSDRGGPGSSKSMPDIADSSHAQSPPTYDPHRRPFSPPTYIAKANGYYDDSGSQTSSVGSQPELVSVKIVKGRAGFGFTIADSPSGQRIKQILDSRRGLELREGDLILEINGRSVRECSHMDVVTLLKECATGAQASMLLQRGEVDLPAASQMQQAYERHDSQGSLTRDSPPRRFSQPPALPPAGIAPPHAQPSYRRPPAEEFRGRQEASRVYEDPQSLYEDSQRVCARAGNSYQEITIHLRRQEAGFGFRILGGEELGQPIRIGAIVPGGSADLDGRMRSGDELVSVDGIPVSGKSHRSVIGLMQQAARNGLVALTIHRPTLSGEPTPPLPPPPTSQPARNNRSSFWTDCFDRRRRRHRDLNRVTSQPAPRATGGEGTGCSAGPPSTVALSFQLSMPEGETKELGLYFVVVYSIATKPWLGRQLPGCGEGSHRGADLCHILHVVGRGRIVCQPNQHFFYNVGHQWKSMLNLVRRVITTTLAVCVHINYRSETRPRQDTRLPSITSTSVLTFIPSVASLDPSTLFNNLYLCSQDGEYFVAELERGNTGFGFSIRGGKEYSMDLFILRVAEEGPAIRQSRMRVGDQIMEINGESTRDMMHARAIELIKS